MIIVKTSSLSYKITELVNLASNIAPLSSYINWVPRLRRFPGPSISHFKVCAFWFATNSILAIDLRFLDYRTNSSLSWKPKWDPEAEST